MQFLYPGFLWALTALAIPVIIHLFHFRKFKKLYFSNIKFLKQVQEQSRSRNRLRHLLILLSRMLVFTFLVLAFARPYNPDKVTKKTAGKTAVSVFVDNSFSMNAMGTGGTLFQLSCDQAIAIANSYDESDRFQLLTNDFEGFRDRFVSRNEFIRQVRELKISYASRKFSSVLARQEDLLIGQDAPNKQRFMISDFQQSVSDIQDFSDHDNITTLLIPVKAETQDNIWVDSAWFESPVRQAGVSEKLFVRVKNSSEQAIENIRITVQVNKQTKIGNVSVPPLGESTAEIGFSNQSNGPHNCRVWIEASEYQPAFDDTLHLAYNVNQYIPILVVNNGDLPSDPVSQVFANDEFFKVVRTNIRNFDPSTIQQFQMVVVNSVDQPGSGIADMLKGFAESGGTVFLFPGKQADVNMWNNLHRQLGVPSIIRRDTMRNSVIAVNQTHPIFYGVLEKENARVSLPEARVHYPIMSGATSGENVLMTMRTGNSFLSGFRVGKGFIYRCAVPALPEGGNFIRHAFFVTTLIRAAELSMQGNPLYIDMGDQNALQVRLPDNNPEKNFSVEDVDTDFSFIPLTMRNTRGMADLMLSTEDGRSMLERAGIYRIMFGGEEQLRLGVNYSRLESDLRAYMPQNLRDMLASEGKNGFQVSDAISDEGSSVNLALNQSGELWKYCLILALAFIGIETLLLRLWKA